MPSEELKETQSRIGPDEEYMTIIIDKELKEKLKDKAESEERNISSTVRYLIKQYVESE